MKKGILAGLIVLCLALFAGTAAVMVTGDRKGPEIAVPSGADVTYEEGSDTALLLEGVTATDDRDGDRKSTRLNSSHKVQSRMPSSA